MAAHRQVEQRRREGEVEQEAGVAVVGEVAGDHERAIAPQKIDLVFEGDAGAAGEARRRPQGTRRPRRPAARSRPPAARAEALGLLRPEASGGIGDALVGQHDGFAGQVGEARREAARRGRLEEVDVEEGAGRDGRRSGARSRRTPHSRHELARAEEASPGHVGVGRERRREPPPGLAGVVGGGQGGVLAVGRRDELEVRRTRQTGAGVSGDEGGGPQGAFLVGEAQQEGADLGPPPHRHDELGDHAERALAAGQVGEAERRQAALGEPGLGLVGGDLAMAVPRRPGATSPWWPGGRPAS